MHQNCPGSTKVDVLTFTPHWPKQQIIESLDLRLAKILVEESA